MIIKLALKISLVSFIIILIISCELINPKEKIPAWVHIESIQVAGGDSSYSFSDAWVNVDGELVGIYELPTSFPILTTGKHNIIIRAGIKQNGISASRTYYPFMTKYEINATLNEQETLELDTIFVEKEENLEIWEENFDASGIKFEKPQNSLSDTIIQFNDEGFQDKCGQITIDEDRSFFEAYSSDKFIIDKESEIYCELNYKASQGFYIGLVFNYFGGDVEQKTIIYIRKSENWNKMYIELTDYIYAKIGNIVDYQLFIGANLENINEPGIIKIDNFRKIEWGQ